MNTYPYNWSVDSCTYKSYLLFLEHDYRVLVYVRHINSFAFFQYFRMFSYHQPTNVAEKKSTTGIMGITMSVAVLMMLPVVSYPNPKTILKTNFFKCKQMFMLYRHLTSFHLPVQPLFGKTPVLLESIYLL